LSKENNSRTRQAKDTLKRAISTRGYTVFLSETKAEFRAIIDRLRERAVPIKRNLSASLECCCCIWYTELIEGTHAHELNLGWIRLVLQM